MNRALNIAREFVAKSLGLTAFARAFTTGQDLDGGQQISLTEAYRQSVWVQAAINQVAQPIKTVGLKFYVGDQEIEDKTLDAFWSRPAHKLTREEWLDATCGWYKLSGEFFWLLDDTWLTRQKNKNRFIVARPGDMREIVQGGELQGWIWTDAAGRQVPLIPDQVVHVKRWNPYNHFRGLGELEAAQLAAETDFSAGRYARDTFRNAGDGGAYVTAKGGVPSEPQQTQIIAALRDKRAARLRGDFRPVFLAGDMEVKDPTVATPDAAFVQNRLTSRHEIFIAFGVPASMADLQASFSIGSASEFYRLILNTCMPLASTIGGGIDHLLSRMDSRVGIESYFEWDEHPVMQAVRSERVASAEKLWKMGVPMKVASEYLDMGVPQYPGWEKSFLPFSVQEVGSVPDPVTDPALAEPTSDDPVQMMMKALKCGHTVPALTCAADDRANLWKSHMARRRPVSDVYKSKFKKELLKARAVVLEKIAAASWQDLKSLSSRSVAADFLFNLADWKGGLLATMRQAGIHALAEAGKQCFEELAFDDVWTMPPAKALEFLTLRENRLTDVADSIFAKVQDTLIAGLDEGDTMKELSDRVRGEFNDMAQGRATTISMTETAAAYGTARHEAMQQAGIEFKQWLTSGNENVRATHNAAQRQTVPLDQPFEVGDEKLMFPGDPDGPAREVINCHCVQISVAEMPQS